MKHMCIYIKVSLLNYNSNYHRQVVYIRYYASDPRIPASGLRGWSN